MISPTCTANSASCGRSAICVGSNRSSCAEYGTSPIAQKVNSVRGAGVVADADGNSRPADAGPAGEGADGMMPDLGKYAETVLSAYAVSLVLIVVLVLLSLRRGRKVKAQLEAVEKKVRKNG